MNYCENCGNKIEENVNFCDYCGKRVNAENKKAAYKQVAPAVVGARKKANGFAIAGFVCAFFIPLLGFVFGGIGLGNARKCKSGLGLAIAALAIAAVLFIVRLIINIPELIDILGDGVSHIDTVFRL